MISDVTLGQFFPGNSLLHRINPAMKLIITILFIVDVFMANTILSLAALFVISLLMIPVAGINFKTVMKALKPLRFIIIFTSVLNIFWTKGETPLVSFRIINIYPEGLVRTLFIILRLSTLVIGSTVLISYTTSPIALTGGLEQLLTPLKKLHVPVNDFAMMMTIALRFIPTLIEETDKIMAAQKSRGADFSTGSLIKRAKALIPIFIPLFLSCIRRADELATAMECRCYNGGAGKTRMNAIRWTALDFISLAAVIAIGVGVFFINKVPAGIFVF